jgi:hypothetical protein
MACENLSLGRLKPCKDTVGGIKNIYFVDYGDFTGIDYNATDTDVIDTLAGTFSAYKYEVHFSSSFTQNIQSSMENGTTAFEQVLEVTLPRLTKEDHKELKLISFGHPHVIVEDQNGNFFVSGLLNGMSVTGGTIVTGLNMGDLSGYTLSLSGMEKVPANFLDTTIVAAGGTIVSGT